MKLIAPCSTCVTEALDKGQAPTSAAIAIELGNGGKLIGTCAKGHTGKIAIQETDFEILFSMGGMALLDGYTREAVSSFSVALERAMEFYVSVVIRDANINEDVIYSLRKITSRSERQLGAFATLYCFCEKESPPILSNRDIEFRNDCIHNGTIPSNDRTKAFAQATMEIIETIIAKAKAGHPGSLGAFFKDHLNEQLSGNDKLLKYATSVLTMVSVLHHAVNVGTFAERLEMLKQYRAHTWAP